MESTRKPLPTLFSLNNTAQLKNRVKCEIKNSPLEFEEVKNNEFRSNYIK